MENTPVMNGNKWEELLGDLEELRNRVKVLQLTSEAQEIFTNKDRKAERIGIVLAYLINQTALLQNLSTELFLVSRSLLGLLPERYDLLLIEEGKEAADECVKNSITAISDAAHNYNKRFAFLAERWANDLEEFAKEITNA